MDPKWNPNEAPKRLHKLDRKKDALGREKAEQVAPKRAPFWSHVAYFGVFFAMFFRGRFFIDFLKVLWLIWGPFGGMFLMSFCQCVKFYAGRVFS